MQDYLIGKNYGITRTNAIGAASRSATRLVDGANPAPAQDQGVWLWLQRDGGNPEALAESAWRSMVLRAAVTAIWLDTYPGVALDGREPR